MGHIATVVIALIDPTSRGAGGAALLRQAGINVRVVMCSTRAWVESGPIAGDQHLGAAGRRDLGIASVKTSMWSTAVFDPARPGRSVTTSDSSVLSHQAVNG